MKSLKRQSKQTSKQNACDMLLLSVPESVVIHMIHIRPLTVSLLSPTSHLSHNTALLIHRHRLRRLLPHHGILALHASIQGPLQLRAQRQFGQILALLLARHEALRRQLLVLELVEAGRYAVDLGLDDVGGDAVGAGREGRGEGVGAVSLGGAAG